MPWEAWARRGLPRAAPPRQGRARPRRGLRSATWGPDPMTGSAASPLRAAPSPPPGRQAQLHERNRLSLAIHHPKHDLLASIRSGAPDHYNPLPGDTCQAENSPPHAGYCGGALPDADLAIQRLRCAGNPRMNKGRVPKSTQPGQPTQDSLPRGRPRRANVAGARAEVRGVDRNEAAEPCLDKLSLPRNRGIKASPSLHLCRKSPSNMRRRGASSSAPQERVARHRKRRARSAMEGIATPHPASPATALGALTRAASVSRHARNAAAATRSRG